MSLILDEEQAALATAVRDLVRREAPIDRVRRVIEQDGGFDTATWAKLTRDLGVAGIGIPEKLGGSGFERLDVAIVAEELGAALTPVPYFSSVVLAQELLLCSADPEAPNACLADLCGGTRTGALAGIWGPDGQWDPERTGVTAEGTGQTYHLSGVASRVLGGSEADLVVVVGRLHGELALFVVDARSAGVVCSPRVSLDLVRPQCDLHFHEAAAEMIEMDDLRGALASVKRMALAVLAAEQLGGMRACLTMTVDYLKEREQFGRIVGSYQGVKHHLAELQIVLDQAESLVRYAIHVGSHSPEEFTTAALTAQAFIGPAYSRLALDCLLLHGGIGFTWEYDAHLYYRRAKSDELLFGPAHVHRRALAQALGLGAA